MLGGGLVRSSSGGSLTGCGLASCVGGSSESSQAAAVAE